MYRIRSRIDSGTHEAKKSCGFYNQMMDVDSVMKYVFILLAVFLYQPATALAPFL